MSNAKSQKASTASDSLSLSDLPPLPPCAQALRSCCTLVAFLIPLKLAFTYIVLVPTILGWLLSRSWRFGLLKGTAEEKKILVPLAFLLLSTLCSAITGIDPAHSFGPLTSLLFFSLTIFVFRDYGAYHYVPLALVSGQALAALHSVVASAFPDRIPSLFLGAVTESGQLALSLFICLGLAWQKYVDGRSVMSPATPRIAITCGVLMTIILSSFGFRTESGLASTALATMWIVGLLGVWFLLRAAPTSLQATRGLLTLSTIHLPLLLTALLVNLKRGPWLGVTVGLAVFCGFFARRLLIALIAGAIITAVSVPPIRERLAVSYEHFTISGGRSTIWKVGAHLMSQYPLGIGYHNSGIMRQFSMEIPPELKHFHNNLINLAAESGVLTAGIFIWFIYAVVSVCFARPWKPMHIALGCAFISWQTAGLVEYNFGDSEVMVIAWLMLGLLLQNIRAAALAKKARSS
jgi:hypothetical protein